MSKPIGWAVLREGDHTFPRFYKRYEDAEDVAGFITVGAHGKIEPLYVHADRARDTRRREKAVESMLAHGWKWDGESWYRP